MEPILYLYKEYGFEKSTISEIVFGHRYIAVLLNNGNIGVCATLGNDFIVSDNELSNLDTTNHNHRIILNAYYNAMFNNSLSEYKIGDITQAVDFKEMKNIVMIGYFRPVVERFNKMGINVHIFDLRDLEISIPMEQQKEYLNNCDAAIVSATTLFNNTFEQITKNSNGDIYILGPSTIMHPYLFEFNKVKLLFGSLFNKNDNAVLDIIRQNLGTRHFLKLGKKIYSQLSTGSRQSQNKK